MPEAKPRKERRISRRHPELRARPEGVWYPELVGVVPGYPKTFETWEARRVRSREQVKRLMAEGKWGRKGVPDGWAGKKAEVTAIRARAAGEAKKVLKVLIDDKYLNNETEDEKKGNLVIGAALEIIFAVDDDPASATYGKPVDSTRDRLSAMKLVAEFTKKKPKTDSAITVARAEDFLSILAAK